MKVEQVIKSSQEQAVAAWVNYLNQTRVNELIAALQAQRVNFEDAMSSMSWALDKIQHEIIEKNRGDVKGMHGFIAEIAECGIGNARQQIQGKVANYLWVNDNSPVDLIRGGVEIQQKFANSGGYLSLQAVKSHLEKYPAYCENGGVYQIPKEHYEKIVALFNMPEEVANKMPTGDGSFSLKQWRFVQTFFADSKIKLEELEPSVLTYKEVQKNQIENTFIAEKESLDATNQAKNDAAYEESKPSLEEGVQVVAVAAFVEGGTAFVFEVVKKIKAGKTVKEFTEDDWKDIASKSGIGLAKGGVRGAAIYSLSNYTATPAAVASAITTASFGIAQQVCLFRKGECSELELIERSEILCLDASVSALSSFLGQAFIPVPVLGAVIGNALGAVLYQVVKDNFNEKEQAILREYAESLRALDETLESKYQTAIETLNASLTAYLSLLDEVFVPDVEAAFESSVKLAKHLNIPDEEILDSREKIEAYFLQ